MHWRRKLWQASFVNNRFVLDRLGLSSGRFATTHYYFGLGCRFLRFDGHGLIIQFRVKEDVSLNEDQFCLLEGSPST